VCTERLAPRIKEGVNRMKVKTNGGPSLTSYGRGEKDSEKKLKKGATRGKCQLSSKWTIRLGTKSRRTGVKNIQPTGVTSKDREGLEFM